MAKVRVSAIIPTYEEEEHIGKCLDSLLNQSLKEYEIIVVDDGSTDKTVEIVEGFTKKHKNLRLIKQNHKGACAAWNNGLQYAKGEVMLALGADMVFGRDYLKDITKPILDGKVLATMHKEMKVANLENWWARARCKVIKSSDKAFIAIRITTLKEIGGFDPSIGYADDEVLYKKKGIKPLMLDVDIYHYNPDKFRDVYKQFMWVGSSIKYRYLLAFLIPVTPVMGVLRAIKHFIKEDPYIPFLPFLPVYHTIKYFGYGIGAWKWILFKKNIR